MYSLSRLIGCIATFILLQSELMAQSIERNTVNSAGESASLSSGTISYSIGETFVGTSSGSSIILIQGFQQPTFLEGAALGLEDLTQLIDIYPNPAKDFVNFRMLDDNLDDLTVTVFNIIGQIQKVPILRSKKIRLNIQQLASGEYFIRLTGNNQFALFKLLKIN